MLLDAPCSGNLIGERDWLQKRDVKGIAQRSVLQRKLLQKASELVKIEGVLIYSTCSLEIEENEENVEWFLKNSKLKSFKTRFKFPFETNPTKKQDSLRFMPQRSKTQGFFVCLFRN